MAQVGQQDTSRLVQSMSELRSSSPIMGTVKETDWLNNFWGWKLGQTEEPAHVRQLLRAREAYDELGYWTADVLKKLSDRSSDERREARDVGVAPGILDQMRSDIKAFKPVYRAMWAKHQAAQNERRHAQVGVQQQARQRQRARQQQAGVDGDDPLQISSSEEDEEESDE